MRQFGSRTRTCVSASRLPPQTQQRLRIYSLPFAVIISVLIVWSSFHRAKETEQYNSLQDSIKTTAKTSTRRFDLTIINSIPCYVCRASSSTRRHPTIVLLHGAAFTKENWKQRGILDDLCQSSIDMSVYAFDLSVKATEEDLKQLLDALKNDENVSLPVDVLVTPSASGKAVVEWSQSNQVSSALKDYVQIWMPIASPAVNSVSPPDKLNSAFPGVRIVAVHGDDDTSGKKTMQLLEKYADAELVSLPGGHPCYLDSPKVFVDFFLRLLRDRNRNT